MRAILNALLTALVALAPSWAIAGEFQPVGSIRDAAIAALGATAANGQAEASVDSRLRMPACAQPLAATVTALAGVVLLLLLRPLVGKSTG